MGLDMECVFISRALLQKICIFLKIYFHPSINKIFSLPKIYQKNPCARYQILAPKLHNTALKERFGERIDIKESDNKDFFRFLVKISYYQLRGDKVKI